jgi:WhiB family redox-sensing transcriptional regulator
MESAACEGMGSTGPALFYDFDLEQDAKAVCETCPVREPCLEHALIYKEVGVWGGKSEKERRTIIRRRRRAAAAS